jgi:hypothetical protein
MRLESLQSLWFQRPGHALLAKSQPASAALIAASAMSPLAINRHGRSPQSKSACRGRAVVRDAHMLRPILDPKRTLWLCFGERGVRNVCGTI